MKSTPCPYCEKPVCVLFQTCPHCSQQARTTTPYLRQGTLECTKYLQWIACPDVAPPWLRYPPCKVDRQNNVTEFLEFNPGWIKTSGGAIEKRFKIGHDDPAKVAQRAKEAGHVEAWLSIGKDLYIKERK
jgi:hypothetical protein